MKIYYSFKKIPAFITELKLKVKLYLRLYSIFLF